MLQLKTKTTQLRVHSFISRTLATAHKRSPKFKTLTDTDISHFKSILPAATILQSDLEPYNTDWLNKYHGSSKLVLFPKTTQHVSSILSYCNKEKIAVVPQGGNTGLVGGGVPVHDEVVINMSKMKEIRHWDGEMGVLIAEAGCILESLDNYLSNEGYMMPLDLGAKGTCQIGGNVSTNAGGLRLLRYGNLHGTVLGLEVVLPNGKIVNQLSTLRKDNTGYDIKQLFIGSEGTLGIITAVSIATPKKPKAVNVALLAVDGYERVLEVFKGAKGELGEILSAFEFFDDGSKNLVSKHLPLVKNPFAEPSPFYILIETNGSNTAHDTEKLSTFLENLMEKEIIVDGSVAQDESQVKGMWAIREGIPEACSKDGVVYKYDVSLPVVELYNLVTAIKIRLEGDESVNNVIGYGHIGDGNLHLNISAKAFTPELTSKIEPYIYEFVSKHGGSISAEHGVGVMKADYLGYSKSDECLDLMKAIKGLIDKEGIMNPYKVFRD